MTVIVLNQWKESKKNTKKKIYISEKLAANRFSDILFTVLSDQRINELGPKYMCMTSTALRNVVVGGGL